MDALSLTQSPYRIEQISTIPPAKVFFVALNPRSASHFNALGRALSQTHDVSFIAAGKAVEKFACDQIRFASDQIKVVDFNPKELDLNDRTVQAQFAIEVAKICSVATTVILDVGHHFFLSLQDAIAQSKKKRNKSTPCVLSYYDSLERWVPGGYSQIASAVMKCSQGVLFANFHLASENVNEAENVVLDLKMPGVGMGYYPLEAAKTLSEERLKREMLRKIFFTNFEYKDNQEKVLVYLGENNAEYFEKSLPKFIDFIQKASMEGHMENTLIIFQPHPDAKEKELNLLRERGFNEIARWFGPSLKKSETLITLKNPQSKTPLCVNWCFNSNMILPFADVVCGRQSHMIYQIALAKIRYMQVSHAIYPDVLIKSGMIFAKV